MIVYKPTDSVLLKRSHWEIWRGFPSDFHLEATPSQGGDEGFWERRRGVWVTPEATRAWQADDGALFFVHGKEGDQAVFLPEPGCARRRRPRWSRPEN